MSKNNLKEKEQIAIKLYEDVAKLLRDNLTRETPLEPYQLLDQWDEIRRDFTVTYYGVVPEEVSSGVYWRRDFKQSALYYQISRKHAKHQEVSVAEAVETKPNFLKRMFNL